MNDTASDKPNPAGGRVMGGVLSFGTVLYILFVLTCAGYLLAHAYNPNEALSDFEKLAIAALIGVFGTGLTAMAAVYSANRQSAAAYQVELLRAETSRQLANQNEAVLSKLADMKTSSDEKLADMKTASDEKLAELKANSDESLARLKVALDAGQMAYRELFGAATTYFYTLRSIALGAWEEEGLKTAETLMISATRHLIHVEEDMRNEWLTFWQWAQEIYRTACGEADELNRPARVADLMEQKQKLGDLKLNLRDLHLRLETTARSRLR